MHFAEFVEMWKNLLTNWPFWCIIVYVNSLLTNTYLEDVMKESSSASKFVSLITYAKAEDVERILAEKSEMLTYAFWIPHDKDEAAPHIHIVVGLVNSRKPNEVSNWFKKCVNDEGVAQNTLAEPVISCDDIVEYLTHSDEKSVQKGKHQYTTEDIRVSRGTLEAFREEKTDLQRHAEAKSKKEAKEDECEQLLDDIIAGTSCRTMARRYGRDFMKNHKAYREYAAMVILEEEGDIEKASQVAGNGFHYWQQQAQREAYEDGVIHALNRVYEMVVSEENGYSNATKDDFKKLLGQISQTERKRKE